MNMRKLGIIGLVACLLGTAHASAALLTYSVVVNNGGANYSSGMGGLFELPQFDSELGNLQSVVLTVTAYAHGGSVAVDNEWSAAGKVQLQLGAYVVVTVPGNQELNLMPAWSTPLSTVGADEDGAPDFAGADSLRLTGGLTLDSQSYRPGDIASYIGTSHMTYSFLGEGFSVVLPLSPLDVGGRLAEETVLPTYSVTAEIRYEYSERGGSGGPGGGNVPEPGTLGMGLAVAGLSLAKWGRRRWMRGRGTAVGQESGRTA